MLSEDVECLYDGDDYETFVDCDWQEDEKYYWETANGDFIPVDNLEVSHIINIVCKFGKDKLESKGHHRIVEKFNQIRKEKGF